MGILEELGRMMGPSRYRAGESPMAKATQRMNRNLGKDMPAKEMAERLAMRIQKGEYWEDVLLDMQDNHPDLDVDEVISTFEELEGVHPSEYAVA